MGGQRQEGSGRAAAGGRPGRKGSWTEGLIIPPLPANVIQVVYTWFLHVTKAAGRQAGQGRSIIAPPPSPLVHAPLPLATPLGPPLPALAPPAPPALPPAPGSA